MKGGYQVWPENPWGLEVEDDEDDVFLIPCRIGVNAGKIEEIIIETNFKKEEGINGTVRGYQQDLYLYIHTLISFDYFILIQGRIL